jgi:hypothetical protein
VKLYTESISCHPIKFASQAETNLS